MNMKQMAEILADPAAMAELQKCTTVRELEARLNKSGAGCTREEALRFLRAWETAAADNESISMEDVKPGAHRKGVLHSVRQALHAVTPGRRTAAGANFSAVTFEQIMKRMSR